MMTQFEFCLARRKLGLSQTEMAGVLGISRQHQIRMEHGARPIMPRTEERVNGLLAGEISLKELLDRWYGPEIDTTPV